MKQLAGCRPDPPLRAAPHHHDDGRLGRGLDSCCYRDRRCDARRGVVLHKASTPNDVAEQGGAGRSGAERSRVRCGAMRCGMVWDVVDTSHEPGI